MEINKPVAGQPNPQLIHVPQLQPQTSQLRSIQSPRSEAPTLVQQLPMESELQKPISKPRHYTNLGNSALGELLELPFEEAIALTTSRQLDKLSIAMRVLSNLAKRDVVASEEAAAILLIRVAVGSTTTKTKGVAQVLASLGDYLPAIWPTSLPDVPGMIKRGEPVFGFTNLNRQALDLMKAKGYL